MFSHELKGLNLFFLLEKTWEIGQSGEGGGVSLGGCGLGRGVSQLTYKVFAKLSPSSS